MKILFIGDNPRCSGGIQTFGRNLKGAFPGALDFLAMGRTKREEEIYPVEDVYEGFSKNIFHKILNRFFSQVRHYLLLKKYDVFILNTPYTLRYFFSRNKGKKIMVQHQTAEFYWSRKIYFNRSEKLLKRVAGEVDSIVTLSPYDRDEFIKRFHLEKKRVVFIRHGSKIPLLKEEKERKKDLIAVCRLNNHQKRLDLAVKAMKKLPDYTLNIYGEGQDKKMLMKLIEDMGIYNVRIYPQTNKVAEAIDRRGIYVMTSDYEGYGISIIEAMRRGLPVIARDTYTAARDIIQGNGVLLNKEWDEDEYVAGIRRIYENYSEYSRRSIELGRRYDLAVFHREWRNLLKKVEG